MLVDGLVGPTQFVEGPDGSLIIAQLNGDEDAKSGQIVLVDRSTGSKVVLVDGLDKPTGVALLNGSLWIMVRRGLLRVTWDGSHSRTASPEVVLESLPYNGRSEGTLTALSDGRLLYETSGELTGTVETGSVTPGSGTLFVFDPATSRSAVVASGTKHAYSHAVVAGNRVVTTEIGAGPGVHPSDELNVVDLSTPADLGWPKCPFDRNSDPECSNAVAPISVFPPDSTPTGVVVDGKYAYVALFVLGTIVRIPIASWKTGEPPAPYETAATGLDGPHSVFIDGNGNLLVSEHMAGRILSYDLSGTRKPKISTP